MNRMEMKFLYVQWVARFYKTPTNVNIIEKVNNRREMNYIISHGALHTREIRNSPKSHYETTNSLIKYVKLSRC